MQGFEAVTLSWKGVSYTVPAERQLRLIAEIEDALADQSGAPAVMVLLRNGGPSHARLAGAFGAALRYAGANVTDDEVYLSIIEDLASGDPATAVKVQDSVLSLLAIVAPPIHRRITGGDEPEKPEGDARDPAG
uniref:hypothetical protein n=1 Tax=Ruegeria arenilitoris TaxID=1173585 RepID=UPI00147EC1EF|nr:hypothetical protein [Ruegeria arenilitoris]